MYMHIYTLQDLSDDRVIPILCTVKVPEFKPSKKVCTPLASMLRYSCIHVAEFYVSTCSLCVQNSMWNACKVRLDARSVRSDL